MGYLYFDESIRDKGGFIIGAAVYSSCDLTSHVHQQWESLGLNPLEYEYKSSALKAGSTAAEEQRRRLRAVLSRTKIGWVLPRFYGHLVQAHNEPGGCHDTATEIFSGVQA